MWVGGCAARVFVCLRCVVCAKAESVGVHALAARAERHAGCVGVGCNRASAECKCCWIDGIIIISSSSIFNSTWPLTCAFLSICICVLCALIVGWKEILGWIVGVLPHGTGTGEGGLLASKAEGRTT